MKDWLKRYVRPIFKSIGLYKLSYRLLMFSISSHYLIVSYLKRRFKKTAVILTYHRIATVSHDPRLLCVRPEVFDTQIKFLQQNTDVISLSELEHRLNTKQLQGNEAVLTFDDGYVDNLTNALPILEKYNVPATIFVTTSQLGKLASFSWDHEYSEHNRAHFLNEEQLKMLAQHPLITIGGHTHNHLRLSNHPPLTQAEDIKTNKRLLETIVEQPVRFFAYPFGGTFDFTATTRKIVQSSGFTLACATISSLVTYSSGRYALPRINVRNDDIKTLAHKLFI